MTTEPLVICTAWNSAFSKLGELCSESVLQHIRRVESREGSGITFVSRLIPDDYPRAPSWFKLDLIRELLVDHPNVLWIDCDALLIDQGDIRECLSSDFILQISQDGNGINCGIMKWSGDSIATPTILNHVESLYEVFKDDKWWEQAALKKVIDDDVIVGAPCWWQFIPKHVFNAYTSDICPETRIVHYPGFSFDEKLKLMEAQEIAIRRNGHGGMGKL